MSEIQRLSALRRWSRPGEHERASLTQRGIPHRRGWHHSLESRNKIRIANTGKTHSEESRHKMSIARIGQKAWNKGLTKETHPSVARIAASRLGKGTKTSEAMLIRSSDAYIEWRKAVFERDNYICQLCGQHGGRLNADHVLKFSDYPDLRLDVNNGRTLCETCHRKTPTYGPPFMTDETRQKISLAQLGKKRKPLSEETKLKIGLANLGKRRSPEARLKMSLAKKGKPHAPLSEETKRKISESHRRRMVLLNVSRS